MAATVTLAFYGQCIADDLWSKAKCVAAGSSATASVSATLKRDQQIHVDLLWNRDSAYIGVKEGGFLYFYGTAPEKMSVYVEFQVPYTQQVDKLSGGFVLDQVQIDKYFTVDGDDLPTTNSNIIGMALSLRKDQSFIVGLHVKSGSSIAGDLIDVSANFGKDTEPLGSAPFAQGSCPRFAGNGMVTVNGMVPPTVVKPDEPQPMMGLDEPTVRRLPPAVRRADRDAVSVRRKNC